MHSILGDISHGMEYPTWHSKVHEGGAELLLAPESVVVLLTPPPGHGLLLETPAIVPDGGEVIAGQVISMQHKKWSGLNTGIALVDAGVATPTLQLLSLQTKSSAEVSYL
jgi:hypothetical protein